MRSRGLEKVVTARPLHSPGFEGGGVLLERELEHEPAGGGFEGEDDRREVGGELDLLGEEDLRRGDLDQAAGEVALGGADDQVGDFSQSVARFLIQNLERLLRQGPACD